MGSTTDRVLGANNQYNAVFTDKKDNSQMDHMDFLKLMVAQMQNQDFTSPMDNSQMITQMVQFSNMQQMQEMATYSKTTYAMSLVGKTVTASRFTLSGELDSTTGVVQKVSLVDNEYVIYVGGKKYTLDQIMSVESGNNGSSTVDPSKYNLQIKDIGKTSATLEWPVPTEDETEAGGLTYSVYYSTEKNFSTVEDVEKGILVGGKNQKNITSQELTDLEEGTTYYANVIVTDKNGVKRVYAATSFKTMGIPKDPPIEEEKPEVPEVPDTKPEVPDTKPEVPDTKPEVPDTKPEAPVVPEEPETPETPVEPEEPTTPPETGTSGDE